MLKDDNISLSDILMEKENDKLEIIRKNKFKIIENPEEENLREKG
jgi:hypothetical protein